MRRADSRACCTAGKSNATRTPMMAITTRSSTSVKPRARRPPKKTVMGYSDRKRERSNESDNHFERTQDYEVLCRESHHGIRNFFIFHLERGDARNAWRSYR